MKKTIIAAAILFASCTALATESHKDRSHKPRGEKQATATQVTDVNQAAQAGASSRAGAISGATAAGGSGGHSTASATGGAGGNSSSSGGSATATGGSVSVTTAGSGSGLTGRMVPDVSTTAPLTSTSCRNGINAGASGSGWGGLLGFFTEDEICELRLLWEQFRAAERHDKANKLLDGMMMMRCEKMAPDQRKLFGDLCPKQPAQEVQNAAFSSAG